VSTPLTDWIGLTVVIGDTVWPDQHHSVTDLGQAIPRVPRCIMGTALHLGWTVLAERSGRRAMTRNPEFGNVTETKDKDYDIIWFTKAGLSNVLRLETHI
jgi:hypothetical protein